VVGETGIIERVSGVIARLGILKVESADLVLL